MGVSPGHNIHQSGSPLARRVRQCRKDHASCAMVLRDYSKPGYNRGCLQPGVQPCVDWRPFTNTKHMH